MSKPNGGKGLSIRKTWGCFPIRLLYLTMELEGSIKVYKLELTFEGVSG